MHQMLFVLVLGVKWGATCCVLFRLLTCTFALNCLCTVVGCCIPGILVAYWL